MKKLIALMLVLALLLCIAGCGSTAGEAQADTENTATENDDLVITAFSAGSADAILIQAGTTAILIDAGLAENAEALTASLRGAGVSRLDCLLLTHYDKDHIGGAPAVLKGIGADCVLCPDYEGSGDAWKNLSSALAGAGNVTTVSDESSYSFGALTLSVLPAADPLSYETAEDEYDNNLSLVTLLSFGSCRFLFTGDIQADRIEELLSSDTDLSCSWIKLPHHGRYEKSLKDLIKASDPDRAVICCSDEEPADDETLNYLQKKDIEVFCTSDGDVVTRCDGSSITVSVS